MERLNQRIQALDPLGNFLAVGGDRGTGLGSFSWPEAVAVAPDGHVWAADTRGNNVQRWSESLASADLLLDGAQVGGFDHVTGLNFGPDGRLWIVDSWNNRVVPYNPATGTFGTPIGIGGIGDGQLNHPEGVAVSATNVYVADTLNNRVQEFTLGGQFVAQVSAGLITPEGLTLASDGTLWVADTGNSRIRHFDANLVDLTDGFGSLGTDEGQFDRPHSLAAHNGFLYVADTYNHRVQKFRIGENTLGLNATADGSISNPGGVAPMYPGGGVTDGSNWYIADSGNSRILKLDASHNATVISATGWNDPRSIALDPDGVHLWVGDQTGPGGTHKVVEITKTGTVVKSIGGTGLYGPWGLYVDTTGVYIADTYDNRIVKINPNTDTEIWSTTTVSGTALSRPRTLTMGSDGNIYAGDTDNDRVVILNRTTGAPIGSFASDRVRAMTSDGNGGLWLGDAKSYRLVHVLNNGTVLGATNGGYGTGPGQFRQPSGIFMSGTSVVVGDQFSYQLQRFTVNGSGAPVYAETIGGTPPAAGGFNGPFGLAYNANGELYVADWFNHRIEKFNADRSFATQWGGYGTGNGSLIFPRGVSVEPDGTVIVTDSENNRLSYFDANGGFVKTLIPLVFGLSRPGQTAVAADGTFWIADSDNNRLVHIDSAAIVLKVVTDAVSEPRGIAIDANGDIFVANDGNDTLTKYDSSGNLIATLATGGAGQGQLKDPHNITIGVVADAELLFVADAGNDRVQVFGTSGASIAAFGSGTLDAPKGVALSPSGDELAVSDHLNNRVMFYHLTPTPPQPPDTIPPVGAVSVPTPNGTYQIGTIGTISGTATDNRGVGSVVVGIKNRDTNLWLQANGTWASTVYRGPATLDIPGGPSVNWTRLWTPVAGNFAVNVITTDAVGNVDPNRPNVLFSVTTSAPDTQAPDGTVSVPTANQSFLLGTVIMSGNATDNVGIGQVLVAIKNKTTSQWWNGSAWQSGFAWAGNASLGSPGAPSSAWSYSWAAPAAGSYLMQVRADDTSGNMDPTKPSVSFSVTATAPDTQAPSPGITVPSANQNFPLGPVITSGSATDNVGVTQVRVAIKNKATSQWWNGSAWQSGFVWGGNATLGSPGAPTTSWSYTFAVPANGSYAIEARADDAAGNFSATTLVSFTVSSSAPDTQAPNPTTNVPSNNQTFSPGLVIMGGNATDNVGVTRVRVAVKNKTTSQWWNGTAWQSTFAWADDATLGSPGSTSTSWTYSFNATSVASYALQVRADDAAGNFTTNPFVNFKVA